MLALGALVFYSFDVSTLGFGLIPIAAVLLMVGWSISLFVIGIVLRFGTGAEALAWGVMFVVLPLSGVFYPVDALPTVLQPVALALPTTHAFAALRGLVDGNGARLGPARRSPRRRPSCSPCSRCWFLVRMLAPLPPPRLHHPLHLIGRRAVGPARVPADGHRCGSERSAPARITPAALVKPARDVAEVEVVAVAARDRGRAEKFAAKHGIPRVLDDYDALIADPDIDAIYNPLPNGLHAEWTERALAAGKHVLCEKPFTANAAEARAGRRRSRRRPDLVVMEAFHYRYHPVARADARDRRESGELGDAAAHRDVDVHPAAAAEGHPVPLRPRRRRRHGHRLLRDPHEPAGRGRASRRSSSAQARLAKPNVDRWMRAELRYPDGLTRHDDVRAAGRARC